MEAAIPLIMFAATFVALLAGYPVAITLAGTALIAAAIGVATGTFEPSFLLAMPNRLFGIMTNQTLIAIPLFVLMGVILERSRIAEELLDAMGKQFGRLPGGIAIAVTLVGMLMAASTGIVGATVVTMGLMSLPSMLKAGYDDRLATGTICATGTLGQIIPPSIALVLLGDVLANAYQQAQLSMGIFNPNTVSVGDLFAGALIPGLLLVLLYLGYIVIRANLNPALAPPIENAERIPLTELLGKVVAPLVLIVTVLGSIISGFATPTEAAGVGAIGAMLLATLRAPRRSRVEHADGYVARMGNISRSTLHTTSMVFFILIGASLFSLVFNGYEGDEVVRAIFQEMPGGVVGATILVMLVIFVLGFILDFIEITFVVVPIVGPILLAMGLDPIWLGVMIAINLQTSFLTPPFGFALFYLRGVTPPEVKTTRIYRGGVPFVILQLAMLGVLALFPELATWLPEALK